MNFTRKTTYFVLSILFGMLAFSLSSCNNERGLSIDDVEKSHTVTTEAFLLQSDGTLVSFSTQDLRSATDSNEMGEITGGGQYFHAQDATIKATAKSGYQLYTLYERDGFSGNDENSGKEGIVNGTSKSITVSVTQDLRFVAVFVGANDSDLRYRDLKIDGVNGDYELRESLSGNEDDVRNGSLSTIGVEEKGLRRANGTFIGWQVSDSEYKNWDIVEPSESWLKVTKSYGTVEYRATPFVSKTAGPRTATFKVGKNGTGEGSGDGDCWRTITITQNSYYENSSIDSPDRFELADGTAVAIPSSLEYKFPGAGGTKDVKELHGSLSKPIYAVYDRYVNGKKIEPIKRDVTVTFGTANPDWVTNKGSMYRAKGNPGSSERRSNAEITFNVGGTVVKTTTIKFSQDVKSHNVDVEAQ